MDQVHEPYRGPLRDSPQSSSAESDKAQAPRHTSRDKRNRYNEPGREMVANGVDSRVNHYSPTAFESDSSPRPSRRRSESTSANRKPSAVAASTKPYSHSETYAHAMNASSTTANSQRHPASTSQYDQQKYRQTEQRVRKLTDSDPRSFVSTEITHNGSHQGEISATQLEEDVRMIYNRLGNIQEEESKTLLEMMRRRTGVLNDLYDHHDWYIKQVNREKEQAVHERNMLLEKVKGLEDQVERLQQQLEVQKQKPVVPSNSYSTHTADGASGADVITAVQHLNEEIFQFAALVADEYQGIPEEHRKLKWDAITMGDMQNMFGYTIATFFDRARKKEHSWVEHALQTCIISSCMGSLTSLNPKTHKGFKSSVDDLYNAIRSAEDQGVSGKWRSLACRHGSKRAKERAKLMKNAIFSLCQNLCWPGWRYLPQHTDAVESIISKTISLREMIYTEVLSGDIVVIFPQPDTPFDPDTMIINDDRNGYTKPVTGEPIICTTDMGLIKLVMEKKQSSDGKWKYREDKTVILKAKVALRDSLPGEPNEMAEVSSRSHVRREI